MAKSAVLAEKPSVARDIARVLQCTKKGNGYFEGADYIVTWALGHLVTLADPEQYGEKWKEWKMETLPMVPDPFKLVPIRQTMKQYNAVKSQLTRGDVKQVIIATDAGREGELVARWILTHAKVDKPVKRLWISSVTDQAIRQGFSHLRDGREYEGLYDAAVARAEADWMIGINATRALTVKHNAQLSTGRVQTPTLAMIAERETQIQAFQPRPFYSLQALTAEGTFQSAEPPSFDREAVQRALDALDAIREGKIIDIKRAPKQQPAPPLFDLTELQKEAHRRWEWSAKETLSTLQNLYERHKIVTYPRTDSKHLSSDMRSTLKERLQSLDMKPYRPVVQAILRAGGQPEPQKGVIDDARVSDHHAIIPTEEAVLLSALTDKERRLFDLIAKRFLAVFVGPHEWEQTTATLAIGEERFVAKGKTVRKAGWKAVYESADEEGDRDRALPHYEKGQIVRVQAVVLHEGKTKPPARFNEGTLLAAMENPKAFMQGETRELIEALHETGGLGTVATRADIIEKLFQSYVIEKRGQDIYTTAKGRQLLELAPAGLKSPALTAEWEVELSKIARGEQTKDAFLAEMEAFARQAVRDVKADSHQFKHDNVTGKACPDCGKMLLEVNGKRGKLYVCQDRECGYKKQVAVSTNARCPVCHKKLELRGEGDGRIFVCSCGHREKLSAFEKRRKQTQAGGKADKRAVQTYMKKQNEPLENTALADALSKLFPKE